MALTVAQRKEILARLVAKVQSGQLDPDAFLDAIVAAIGTDKTKLVALVDAEVVQYKADLAAARAQQEASVLSIDAKLTEYA